jgi:hypothetical protein
MIKVDNRPFEKKRKEIQRLITKLKSVRNTMRVADLAKSIIFKRVKSGFGVNDDQKANAIKRRLLALGGGGQNPAEARRKYLLFRRTIDLGLFGTIGKSNLTLTGQMLDALDSKILSNGFRIDIKNTVRRKIGNERTTITNSQVANFVSEKRPFLALTIPEQRIVLKEYERIIRELSRTIR